MPRQKATEQNDERRYRLTWKEEKLILGIRNNKFEASDELVNNTIQAGAKINEIAFNNRMLGLKQRQLIKENEELKLQIKTLLDLPFSRLKEIEIIPHAKGSEATAVMMYSDAHFEKRIEAHTVNGLNEYNLDIAKKRNDRFFERCIRLLNIFRKDIEIKDVVLWLGGDFIDGYIHEENKETNELSPTEAILYATDRLTEGINFILNHGRLHKLYVVCNYGNHSRTTDKVQHSTGYANNYEWLMYEWLEKQYGSSKTIQFNIPKGYFGYLKIYDKVVRYHHGNYLRYLGGSGGLYIPTNKAISNWNIQNRADLDIFGHFHQLKLDVGSDNFLVNGSVCGFDPYAISIKAKYEPPRQGFFLLDKTRGKTITAPIILE